MSTYGKIASKNSCVNDIYDISSSLLKYIFGAIVHVLCALFNQCIKVVPLFKGKGERGCVKSYRPISLVPAISKVLEVGINLRLLSFIESKNFFSPSQYAYRTGRSTTDLVREVVWRVVSAREKGLQVALVCCDLSRAFDTANHQLVAAKLEHYGIRGPALNVILSFMANRRQSVVGDGGKLYSAEACSIMGVPQGSCLSNNLFSILLNDLPAAFSDLDVFMYADDVAAVVTGKSSTELQQNLNAVACRLTRWFRTNGLALNVDKTCFMKFSLDGKPAPPLSVSVEGTALQQVNSTKLLGFILDSALTWSAHIDQLCEKLGQACYALKRLATTATKEAVRSCYFATIHSRLSYGTELWAQAADRDRVFTMQRRAIRALVGVPFDHPTEELFDAENIMTLPSLFVYQTAIFVRNNLESFNRRDKDVSYSLRHPDKLRSVTHKLAKSEKSVYVLGPIIYNKLPERVRTAASTTIFKNKLRRWLLEKRLLDYKL